MDIQVSTQLTADVERESQKKIKLLCKIGLIVGIIGLLSYIIIGVTCFEEDEEPFWLEIILLASSVLFALGLVIPITLNVVTKKSLKAVGNMVNRFEFNEEYFTVSSYRGEEKMAEAKHYYREVTKTRETENYVYLHIGIRGAYPIEISRLTEEEKAWILDLKKKN